MDDDILDAYAEWCERNEDLSYSEEYSEWLMKNELVWNGDRLIELQEKQHRFNEFLAQRKS